MQTTTESCPRCGEDLEINTAGLDQRVRCNACGSAFRAIYDAEFDGIWRGNWTLYPVGQPSGMERVRGIVSRVIDRLGGVGWPAGAPPATPLRRRAEPIADAQTLRKLRPRAGRWPTRRLSRAPTSHCSHCWAQGGPPVPGLPFVWGYPSTRPFAERKVNYYCERHTQEARDMNIELIPAPGGAELTRLFLRRFSNGDGGTGGAQ
jgi:hypothetical protein